MYDLSLKLKIQQAHKFSKFQKQFSTKIGNFE